MAILTDKCISAEIGYFRRDPASETVSYLFGFRKFGRRVFLPGFPESEAGFTLSAGYETIPILVFFENVWAGKGRFEWAVSGPASRLTIRAFRSGNLPDGGVVFDFSSENLFSATGARPAYPHGSLHLCVPAFAFRDFLEELREAFLRFDAAYRIFHEFYAVFDYVGSESRALFCLRFRKFMQSRFYFLGREIAGEKGAALRFRFRIWENRTAGVAALREDTLAAIARELPRQFPDIRNLRFEYVAGDRADRFACDR